MPIDFADTAANFLEFPAYYYYRFYSSDGLEVYVLRDETPPKITGGLGGWEIVDRRRRKGLTNWTGRQPWQMSLPVLFNGLFNPAYGVDSDIAILNRMAFGDNYVIPPTVKVDGVVPVQGITWVIQDIQYGDNAMWQKDDESGMMVRVRQDAVVQLLQYVEEDVVPTSTSKTTTAKSNLVPPHVTTSGETPRGIAKGTYGIGQKWKLLRKLNPTIVRSPYQVLDGGLTLQMPARNMPLPAKHTSSGV